MVQHVTKNWFEKVLAAYDSLPRELRDAIKEDHVYSDWDIIELAKEHAAKEKAP